MFQRVKISSERSSCVTLLKGIPQGSGLGPFLFNISIHECVNKILVYENMLFDQLY